MRVALALGLLLVGTALAGCIGGDGEGLDENQFDRMNPLADKLPVKAHLPGGLPVGPGQLPGPLGALWLDIGADAVEPTLGITSTGTIFYAAATFDPGLLPVTKVLKSTDNGMTWTETGPRLPTGQHAPPATGDPYVYVDPATDRVYNFDMFPPLVCSYISWSDDEGDTWTQQPVGCGTAPPYDHQTLAAGPARMLPTAGYENVLYQCVNRIADSICSRSLDGGLTWLTGTSVFLGYEPTEAELDTSAPPTSVLGGAFEGLCGGLHGHLAVSPADGTAYLPREYCGKPYVGITTDDGTTWSQVLVADVPASSGPDPAVAVDDAGNAYYLFVGEEGGLFLSVSTDGGTTWSPPKDVAAPGVTAAHLPTIAAGAKGHIAFAYTGTENLPDGYANPEFDEFPTPDDGDIAKATWNGYLAVMTDALSDRPVIQTAYVNDPADPLVRGYCGPGRCPGMYDFIDVVISPVDGRPFAAFVDACTDVCATPEGTAGDTDGFAGAVATLGAGPSLHGTGPLDALS